MGERTRQQTWDFGLDPDEAFEPADDEAQFDRALPHVMTALGPIDPESLGVTLPHEIVLASPPGDDADVARDDSHRALAALEEYFLAGGRSIVDRATADYGRDARAIAWLASRSPVHVVVATGHHQDRFAAPFLGERTAEEIAVATVGELKDGIGETGVHAGVIVAATSLNGITRVEERALRAAAWAQLETGAPISTYTEAGTMALEQLAILRAEGTELSRVIVGTPGERLDEAYLLRVLETGAIVAIAPNAQASGGGDDERAVMVRRLIDAGYGDQLLLAGNLARRSAQSADGGTPGWTYVIEGFPLMLMEQGVAATEVRRMLVENAARALTTRPPSRHIP